MSNDAEVMTAASMHLALHLPVLAPTGDVLPALGDRHPTSQVFGLAAPHPPTVDVPPCRQRLPGGR